MYNGLSTYSFLKGVIVKLFGFNIILHPYFILVSSILAASGIILLFINTNKNENLRIDILMVSMTLALIPYLLLYSTLAVLIFRHLEVTLFNIRFIHYFIFRRYIFGDISFDAIIGGVIIFFLSSHATNWWSFKGGNLVKIDDPHSQLVNLVNEISIKVGIKTPKLYYFSDATPQLFTNGTSRNPKIAISVGALEIFDNNELKAALAHEIMHIKNADLNLKWASTGLRLASILTPIIHILQPLLFKEQEFRADAMVAHIYGKEYLISALLKVSQFKCNTKINSLYFNYNPSMINSIIGYPTIRERINRLKAL